MRIKTIALLGLAAVLFTSCFKEDIKDLQSQIDALKSGSIATIETQITNINKTIDALEKSQADVKTQLSSEIQSLKSYVDIELKNNKDWTSATFATLEQYDKLCEVVASIPGGVSSDVMETMKKWVNEQLTDYYTIAQTNAQIDSLAAAGAENDSTLLAKIDEQKLALEKAKAQITSSYKAAIEEAIKTLDGKLSEKIAKDIADAKVALQSQIDSIKDRLKIAEGQIAALLNQIQSIVVVPDYSDGSVDVVDGKIIFDVSPSRVINEILQRKDKLSFFDLKIKNVLTKSEESDEKEPKHPIYISAVTLNSANQLVVSINSEGRELGKVYDVSLSINYGSTDKRSEYFLLSDVGTYKFELERAYYLLSRVFVSKENEKGYIASNALFNMSSDDVTYGGSGFNSLAALNEFSYDKKNSVIVDYFNDAYDCIVSLTNSVEKLKLYDFEGTRSVVAEEIGIRSYLYYTLASSWNNPPYVDDKMNIVTKASRKDFLETCYNDVMYSTESLEVRESKSDTEKTRVITKHFAYAIAAKFCILLSKIENEYGYCDLASKYLNSVLKSNLYHLVPSDAYENLFHKQGNGNPEKIFELAIPVTDGTLEFGGWNSSRFVADPSAVVSGGIDSDGNFGVPQWLGDLFIENDGMDSYRRKATINHIDEVVYDMKYKDDALNAMTREQKMVSNRLGIKSSGLKGQSFWLPVKTMSKSSDVCTDKFGNPYIVLTVMRFAETLLDYAEVSISLGNIREALKALNTIQERAGTYAMTEPGQTDIIIAALKTEKALELWMEGGRQMDIRRWKDADAIKRMKTAGTQNTILYDKLTRQPKSSDRGLVWENGTKDNSRFYTVLTNQFSSGKVGYQDKHEYFPIPSSFLAKYPKVEQDPAWK